MVLQPGWWWWLRNEHDPRNALTIYFAKNRFRRSILGNEGKKSTKLSSISDNNITKEKKVDLPRRGTKREEKKKKGFPIQWPRRSLHLEGQEGREEGEEGLIEIPFLLLGFDSEGKRRAWTSSGRTLSVN